MGPECTSNESRRPGDSPKLILNHFLLLSAFQLLTHASIMSLYICCYLCLSASTFLLHLSFTTCLSFFLSFLSNKDRLSSCFFLSHCNLCNAFHQHTSPVVLFEEGQTTFINKTCGGRQCGLINDAQFKT